MRAISLATMILIQVTLLGCAVVRPTLPADYQDCPMADIDRWTLTTKPPIDAKKLLDLASPILKPPFPDARIKLIWFFSTEGHILLCRAVKSFNDLPSVRGCGASSWEFVRNNNTWMVPAGGERIIVCG